MKFKLEKEYFILMPETAEEEKKLNETADSELTKMLPPGSIMKIKRGKKAI